MKKPILVFLLIMLVTIVNAQVKLNDSVFTEVEIMPTFKYGNFLTYVGQNIQYPLNDYKNGIHGKVFVQFTVGRDGGVRNVTIVRPVSPAIDTEALRIVRSSPAWNPGIQNGKKVNVQYTIPINFKITPVVADSASNEKALTDDDILAAPVQDQRAQTTATNNEIFTAVEYPPSYPGGLIKLNEYFKQTLQALHNINDAQLIVQFIVEKNGSLSNFKILRSTNDAANTQAITLLTNCPKWNPGVQNGNNVRCTFTIQMNISPSE